MTVYYPNTAGSTGWHGDDADCPPDTLAFDCAAPDAEVEIAEADRNTISTDDENHVDRDETTQKAGHRFKYLISEAVVNVTRIDITAKGYGTAEDFMAQPVYGWKLFIRDVDGGSWEELDAGVGEAKETLTGFKDADIDHYIEVDGADKYVHALIQSNPADAIQEWEVLDYHQNCEITAAAAGNPWYAYAQQVA